MSALGDRLRDERRRAGRTLHDVEAATRIRGRLLEALENGEYDRLPSPAYVKGYILSYARFLDIPTEPLLEMFEHEMASKPPREHRLAIPEAHLPKHEEVHAIPMRTGLVIAAVLVGVALALWGIGRLVAGPKASGPSPLPTSASEATSQPNAGASTAPTVPGVVDAPEPATSTAVEETPASFQLRVTIDKREASWLVVKIDGLTAYQGTLTDGASRTWDVVGEASVAMGRPSAVTVLRDGVKVTDKPEIIAKVPTLILRAE